MGVDNSPHSPNPDLKSAKRPQPRCCGGSNILTVEIEPAADRYGGHQILLESIVTVTYGSDCVEEYVGTAPVYDTCPVVELTAIPNPGYEVQWIGCDTISEGKCIVTPRAVTDEEPQGAVVTANFELQDGFIRVVMNGGSAEDAKVWIKKPQKYDFLYPEQSEYCYDVCIVDTRELTEIIFKRAGGDWDTWGGDFLSCTETGNNSLITCTIDAPATGEVTATWE